MAFPESPNYSKINKTVNERHSDTQNGNNQDTKTNGGKTRHITHIMSRRTRRMTRITLSTKQIMVRLFVMRIKYITH